MKKIITVEKVKPLLDEGLTYGEIASILNVKRNSIGRFCRKYFGKLLDRGKSTRQCLPISQEQKEILFGSLLGDLCIAKHNKTYRGSITHSVKQKDYFNYLYSKLSSLAGIPRKIKTKVKNKVYDEYAFTIRPNTNLKSLYDDFYNDFNNKKDVPYNLELLTPLAISIWFMDDGFLVNNGHSKTLGFSTCSFSLEGLLRLQKHLLHTYNIHTIIRKNFYLIVKRESYLHLKEILSPYIIDSMRYKLG